MLKWLWLLLPLPVIPAALLLLGNDAGAFLIWWLTFAIIGWLVWPLSAQLFPNGDSGYLLAKPIGLVLTSLLLWTLSYLRILPFQRWAIGVVLCAVGLAAWLIRNNWKQVISPGNAAERIRRAAAGELLFGAALLFWTFARGLKPEIDGLEKFMDIGFMNSLWRTDFLPALDMWFAGGTINYYYYGQYVYTFVAKLVDIRPEISYNLSLAATFAMTFSLAYAVVSRLMTLLRSHISRLPAAVPAFGGLCGGFLVAVFGNSHSFLYDLNSPGHQLLSGLKSLMLVGGETLKPFFFSDPTRFIGYNPDTIDKTIHEFPYYSFLVADLHAHMINLAFVLLLLALLIQLLSSISLHKAADDCRLNQQRLSSSPDREWHRGEMKQMFSRLLTTIRSGPLLLIVVLLGLFMMGNYWDFAIYFVVTTMVLLLVNVRGYGRIRLIGIPVFILQCAMILIPFLTISDPFWAVAIFAAVLAANHYLTLLLGDALTLTGAQMSWLFFAAHLVSLPFNASFEPISKKIALAVNHTPLWQLLILWGPHLLAGLLFVVFLLSVGRPGGRIRKIFPPAPEDRQDAIAPENRVSAFFLRHSPADLLVCIMLICGIGLLIVPELVYVVDIYSGDYKRANTMFKFTYQAFVLLSLVWAYALVRVSAFFVSTCGKAKTKPAWSSALLAIALIIMLIFPGWYPILANKQWLDDFDPANFKGLNGLVNMESKNSLQIPGELGGELAADYEAILWINENITGQSVILESSGESYTDYCRISAFTGLPTVIGWQTHEWLWRTSRLSPEAYTTIVSPRETDVRLMYTTADQTVRQDLIKKYQVAYIIVGDLERSKYNVIEDDLLLDLGTVVFEKNNLVIIKIRQE